MYIKALFGLFVCCTLLSATEGQVVITDVAPTEFPHIVKIQFNEQLTVQTSTGIFVSARYVFSSFPPGMPRTKDSFTVTDQLGTVLPVVKYEGSGILHYLKFCEKFKGTPLNLSLSSFDSWATNVSAQMMFFNTTSNTLKKVSVTLLDNSTCSTITPFDFADVICMASDVTTDFCKETHKDSTSDPPYKMYSLVAIGSQINGVLASGQCTGGNLTSDRPYFFHLKLSSYRQDIIDLVPKVDIV
ncbi:Hypothetical predicted protein [Cloeon dipterum]|uniref:Peptidase S1 domain-containing protein n=1 Tax=Cloeon dipterum TaxID=197152 RepID=A0A8S1EEA7_9INSE|nr:Hypothetical predicted protein [Cloeon dipterum]